LECPSRHPKVYFLLEWLFCRPVCWRGVRSVAGLKNFRFSFPRYSGGGWGGVDEATPNLTVARMAKSPLGRGLGALLGGASSVPSSSTAPIVAPEVRGEEGEKIIQLAVGEVGPSPLQPRRVFAEENLAELVDSIRARGIFQPLIVRRSPKGSGYELIAGERRWRAARTLNLAKVPGVSGFDSSPWDFSASDCPSLSERKRVRVDRRGEALESGPHLKPGKGSSDCAAGNGSAGVGAGLN